MVHGLVLHREGVPARGFGHPLRQVGANALRPVLEPPRWVLDHLGHLRTCHLLLGHGEAEVEVEIVAVRRHIGELPSHPALVRLQLLVRRSGDGDQRHVAVVHMRHRRIDVVRQRGAPEAGGFIARAEHQVVDEELRAAVVLLLHPYPWQLAPLLRQLLVEIAELLFPLEQFGAGCLPLFLRPHVALGHGLFFRDVSDPRSLDPFDRTVKRTVERTDGVVRRKHRVHVDRLS